MSRFTSIPTVSRTAQLLMLLGLVFAAPTAFAAPWIDNPTLTEPEKKRFTAELKYRYSERVYTPAVKLPVVDKPEQPAAKLYGDPEEAVFAHLAAAKANDLQWWLNTWDAGSQTVVNAEPKLEESLKKLSELLNSDVVQLVRWVQTGTRILLTWRVGNQGKEQPVALSLGELGWRVSLDMHSDPVMKKLAQGGSSPSPGQQVGTQ